MSKLYLDYVISLYIYIYIYIYIYTVDIKSLHTPVKMAGFCDVKKNETKINNF